jgi:uncharacterized protein (TIGR00297 family)
MLSFEMTGGLDQTNLILAFILVLILMVVSRVRHILNETGTWAAAALGLGVAIAGHWTWLLILLSFLTSGFAVTRWRIDDKRAKGLHEGQDGERGWTNVASNGGVPLAIALYAGWSGEWQTTMPIFAAAVAVASADTFASEIGSLDERVRMITTFKPCEPGINGGFSPNGQMAALAGAALIGVIGAGLGLLVDAEAVVHPLRFILSMTAIGFIGCQIDSLLGAWFENRGLIGKGTVNALAITCGALLAAFALPALPF